MSITDELREYVEKQIKWLDASKVHYNKLLSIADRIDAANETVMSNAGQLLADVEKDRDYNYANWQECKQKVLQGNLTFDELNAKIECLEDELSHRIELPKDEDGEYIRIGDVLTDDAEFKSEGKVMRLMLEDDGWMVGLGCGGWTEPSIHEWHHYHTPTVEDMLWELLGKITPTMEDNEAVPIVAAYAERLQLAGDAAGPNELALAYHVGYDDALAKRKPDASKVVRQ